MKKKCGSSILCLVLLVTFTTNVFLFKPQVARADVASLAIGGMMLEGSASAVGGAIIASAPYVAAFAVVCVGLGVVYQNREQIQASLVGAYNYAKAQGKNLLDYFSTSADGKVIVNSEGLSLISSSIKEYKLSSSSIDIVGHIGDFAFSKGTTANPSGLKIDFPLTGSDSIVLMITGNAIAPYLQPSAEVLMDGKNLHYITNIFGSISGVAPKPLWVGITYSATGWKYYNSWTSENDLRAKMARSYGHSASGSICADFTIGVIQEADASGSISVDRLLGDSIGVTDGVSAIPTFKNPSISLDKDVAISVPTDVTWDKVIDKTHDTTLDMTNTDVKPTNPDLGLPGSVSIDFSPLQIAVSDRFPFCIPFDFINAFKMFQSEASVPKFKVEFPSQYMIGGGSFEIDFSNFSGIAAILRYFILLVFLTGLIKKTKDLMGGA